MRSWPWARRRGGGRSASTTNSTRAPVSSNTIGRACAFTAERSIVVPQPFLLSGGASMSARKSSLSALGDAWLMGHPDASPEMQSGKWLGADGTVRGLRDAFKAFGRPGI
eukprot:1005638-Alexandrium_andersonii.AAC.1